MTAAPGKIEFIPVPVAEAIRPEDVEGRQSGEYIAQLIEDAGVKLQEHDVVAISSKVAAFLDDGLVLLEDVLPTRKARWLGKLFNRDPRKIQLVLEQGDVMLVIPMRKIINIPKIKDIMARRTDDPERMVKGYENNNSFTFIVKKHALFLDEAGIDHTNSPDEYVSLLPADPCKLSSEIRSGLQERFGADVAVILTDTVTSVGRIGSQDQAIGYSGIDPVTRNTFTLDLFGIPRAGGIDLVIDSISGMAGLVMGQTIEKTPIVVVRGLSYDQERADELPGMEAVSWPAGVENKLAFLTVLSTLKYKIGSALSFQRKTPISRINRS